MCGDDAVLKLFPSTVRNSDGKLQSNIDMHYYTEKNIVFSGKGYEFADKFCFDGLSDLLKNASENSVINEKLNREKSIIFMHLLSTDTSGHSFQDQLRTYEQYINKLDGKLEIAVNIINDFFHDNATSFILTSDHGMSWYGAHGDMDPDNTMTPVVAWGSGFIKYSNKSNILAKSTSTHRDNDIFLSGWDSLGDALRIDINQADIAPLLASLLSIPIPI